MLEPLRHPVPVFPLPDFVMFPGACADLHVFETRYRALVRDALATDRLLVLTALRPGWEREYHASPAFHALGCLARLEDVAWRPDDRFDVRASGLARVRLGAIAREFPYRAVRVEELPHAPYAEDDPLVASERAALRAGWQRLTGQPLEQLPMLPAGERTYAAMVGAACMALPAGVEEKLGWLALDSIVERGARLREWMERATRGPDAPPGTPGGALN
jgi:Lon protease-like protein